jgi:hypothetical protein
LRACSMNALWSLNSVPALTDLHSRGVSTHRSDRQAKVRLTKAQSIHRCAAWD